MSVRTIFLTGGTGAWGRAALRAFRERGDEFRIIALVRPGKRSDQLSRDFADWPLGLEILPGDLTDPAAVARGISRADVVLHLGGLVSPVADEQPALTTATNVGGIKNIIAAVKALPDPSRVPVIAVGSVAEEGSRLPPHHWGRVGDPIFAAAFDGYAQSKINAERELVDSGLPKWTWLRQTAILHPGLFRTMDPIMTHMPLDGVMEWVSEEDSARLAVALSSEGVPEEVWGNIWHVGGGEPWRLTNWQFLNATARALGIEDPRKLFDRNWFALKNFHGSWFTDSDRLNELVPYRKDTVEAAFARASTVLPASLKGLSKAAAPLAKQIFRGIAGQHRGTIGAIKRGEEPEIRAFFGSWETWAAIGDWSTYVPVEPSRRPTVIDHGFDESHPPMSWTPLDYAGAAGFRGGRLASSGSDLERGAIGRPLRWVCAEGHWFRMSPRLVLQGGHWCPDCVQRPDEYARQAEKNKFLAQVMP
ncbi:MAG: NAD(P)-dependent oxidoreductase [Microbacteriaceae bacterium]|nr:NAD(P)-dependent oxidoreductase [Microbacteriaceae bacterium]